MKWIKIIKEFLTAPAEKLPSVEPEPQDTSSVGKSKIAEVCPYCLSKNFVKRGTRKNRHQVVQLYLCRNGECKRTFTAQDVKGKHFPLNIVIEGMSYYNLGFTLEESCSLLKQKFGVSPEAATLSEWIEEYKSLYRYERLRPYAVKMFSPKNVVEVVTMAHRKQAWNLRLRLRQPTQLLLAQHRVNLFPPSQLRLNLFLARQSR